MKLHSPRDGIDLSYPEWACVCIYVSYSIQLFDPYIADNGDYFRSIFLAFNHCTLFIIS